MKVLRYRKNGMLSCGLLRDGAVHRITGDIFGQYEILEESCPLEEVELLAPVVPEKVVGMGINYYDFIAAMNIPEPQFPYIFLKSPTAIIPDGGEVLIPHRGDVVNYEAELAVVIGKACKNATEESALSYVFGYTCCNDMTNRTDLLRDNHMGVAKNYDTFLPLGPVIETDIGWEHRGIRLYLNGEKKLDGNTDSMIFKVPKTIAFISSIMSLHPGDVILTGSPAGVTSVKKGDVMRIAIDGIGELTNAVGMQ